MLYSELGKDKLKISTLALGTWAFASDGFWGEQDEKDSRETILAALDMGINFFDTAELYGMGHSEEVLGRALKGLRDRAVIATKAGAANLSKEDLINACEKSLSRLGTDYIDLYQIHWPSPTVPMEETHEALLRLKEAGKIRNIGVCNFGVKNLKKIVPYGTVISNQLPYSILWRAIEDDIIPECEKNEIGILTYSSLSQGLLSGKYKTADEVPKGRTGTRYFASTRSNGRHGEAGMEAETFEAIARIRNICETYSLPISSAAISWVLNRPGISSVIVGARSPEQLKDLVSASELKLPAGAVGELTSATEDLKKVVGNNADMWEGKAKSRIN
jgi:aryl-alcohol dehydrogenase-like predicted oxidoreductase